MPAPKPAYNEPKPPGLLVALPWCLLNLPPMEAEDTMLSQLVTRGFCAGDAVISCPYEVFLSRDRLRDMLASERDRVFSLKW